MERRIQKKLAQILGKEHLLTDWENRTCYGYDATNRLFLPDAVVFPGTTNEISEIVRLANQHRFPVIPRGAGSGFTGGSVPVQRGVVLSLERMNRIIEIDEADLVAVVEPGVVTGQLHRETSRKGLFFPPDPASMEFSTIGGNVAECAGGMRAFKYGVTRDYVLGLEVVLPDGEILQTGGRTIKNVVGYDLMRLFVGSEGTLGIITKITLKLIPLPGARGTIQAFFGALEDAGRAISRVLEARIFPSAMELVDRASLECVAKTRNLDFPREAQAMLLIEVDGPKVAISELIHAVQEVCADFAPLSIRASCDETEAEALWAVRRAISPSLARIRPHRLNEDIVVPRSRLPEVIMRVQAIAKDHQIPIATFGHAGDGNLHVAVLHDRANRHETSRAEAALETVMRTTLELGGSISGEHGIGTSKAAFLPLEVSEVSLELMKRIKGLLDPNGVLNPGKIFLNHVTAPSPFPDSTRGAHHG
jgi:glycolate oxidase